jgi:hypothetical protein
MARRCLPDHLTDNYVNLTKRLGIPGHFHELGHFSATEAIASGADVHINLIGHSLFWTGAGQRKPWTTASAVELAAIGPKTIVEPTGAHGLGPEAADTLEKPSVGGDKDDGASGGGRLRHQSVVAVVSGVDDAHTVNVCLSDAGAGGAFEDYHRR